MLRSMAMNKLNFLLVEVNGIVIWGWGIMGEIVGSGAANSSNPQVSAKVPVESSRVGMQPNQGHWRRSSDTRLCAH